MEVGTYNTPMKHFSSLFRLKFAVKSLPSFTSNLDHARPFRKRARKWEKKKKELKMRSEKSCELHKINCFPNKPWKRKKKKPRTKKEEKGRKRKETNVSLAMVFWPSFDRSLSFFFFFLPDCWDSAKDYSSWTYLFVRSFPLNSLGTYRPPIPTWISKRAL